MGKGLKKGLLIGTSALMMLSLGAGLNTGSVNARHRRHYRYHRVYRRRPNANMWYKRNAKRLNRRGRKSIFYRRGWYDAQYDPSYGSEARISPTYASNANYRHGWIIGYTNTLDYGAPLGTTKYSSYWRAINLYNKGRRYARLRHIHHCIYIDAPNGHWERTRNQAIDEYSRQLAHGYNEEDAYPSNRI